MMCAVAVAVVAFYFLHSSHTIDFNAEVGKWLLTVAAGLVLTGALSMVVKQIDQRRTERDAWHAVLKDLVAANQTVMLARLRLAAQQSALTYQEQLAEIMRARVELRGIEVIGLVTGDPALRGNVSAMHKYLDALGSEYETGYLCVARQQRLDELWLTGQMTAANVGTGGPTLPVPLAEPTKAWRLLQDREGFPRLAALLDHSAFPIDTFRTSLKRAKGCLEVRAGFRDRSMVDVIDSAGRFSDHARNAWRGTPTCLMRQESASWHVLATSSVLVTRRIAMPSRRRRSSCPRPRRTRSVRSTLCLSAASPQRKTRQRRRGPELPCRREAIQFRPNAVLMLKRHG